jgi:hypothetical protein
MITEESSEYEYGHNYLEVISRLLSGASKSADLRVLGVQLPLRHHDFLNFLNELQ